MTAILPATVTLFPKDVLPVIFAVPPTVNLLARETEFKPIVKLPFPEIRPTSSFAVIPLIWNIIGFPAAS